MIETPGRFKSMHRFRSLLRHGRQAAGDRAGRAAPDNHQPSQAAHPPAQSQASFKDQRAKSEVFARR